MEVACLYDAMKLAMDYGQGHNSSTNVDIYQVKIVNVIKLILLKLVYKDTDYVKNYLVPNYFSVLGSISTK